MEEKLLAFFDFEELNNFLNGILNREHVGVEDLLDELITGDTSSFFRLFGKYIHEVLWGNLEQCRELFLGILFLGIFAIILGSMSDLFKSSQIAVFSRYFVFMFVSLLLLKCFVNSYESAKVLLGEMESFIKALMPVFCIALGMSNGTVTAAAHYELQLALLFLVEKVMIAFLLPLVQVYCILHVMNQLSDGNRFGGILSLVKKIIMYVTKGSLFVSIGGSFIQAALMPAIDSLGNRMLLKTISLFPGLGDYAGAIGEMVLQGASLIKSSVGIIGIFILLLMCVRPVLVTLMYGAVIRLSSALLQISGEKRFTGHIWKMADSFFLLARIQFFGGGIFFVSIAVAVMAFAGR